MPEEPSPEQDRYEGEPGVSLEQLANMKKFLTISGIPGCNPQASDEAFELFAEALTKVLPKHDPVPGGCANCHATTMFEVIRQYVAVLEATVNVIDGLSRGEFGWKQFIDMQPDEPTATNANLN